MSVARIGEFRARAGKSDELREFLRTVVVPGVTSSAGCLSCQTLQSQDDPARFVVIEVWESVAAHQASVKAIAPEAIARVMTLLDGPPAGGSYFDVRDEVRGDAGAVLE